MSDKKQVILDYDYYQNLKESAQLNAEKMTSLVRLGVQDSEITKITLLPVSLRVEIVKDNDVIVNMTIINNSRLYQLMEMKEYSINRVINFIKSELKCYLDEHKKAEEKKMTFFQKVLNLFK
jgi:hypothetical protein